MNSEQITAFLQEHWSWVTLIIGAVLLIGAIMNWNWLCDPTGKPDSHRYGRGSRRVIFFLLGIVLIVTSVNLRRPQKQGQAADGVRRVVRRAKS